MMVCKSFAVLSVAMAVAMLGWMGNSIAQAGTVAPEAKADLVDTQGKSVGSAEISEANGTVFIHVKVKGLTPGAHGIHIHENAKCEGPKFASAGGHFHVGEQHHGLMNPKGPHSGDLGNLAVKSDGTADQIFKTKTVSLGGEANSLFKPNGTSLVIHAGTDDQKSDPSGNSGDRIACGVISKI